jgi:hypothetical protein
MLSTTPYRPSARCRRTASMTLRAGTAALAVAGVVGLAACGGSSTSTTQAAIDGYHNAGNAICKKALADISPVTTRMIAAEKLKQTPTLADVTALDNAQAKLQHDLTALTPPPTLKTSADKMSTDFAAVVARVRTLLKHYGAQSIGYDGIDTTLIHGTNTLDTDLKALGLNACL